LKHLVFVIILVLLSLILALSGCFMLDFFKKPASYYGEPIVKNQPYLSPTSEDAIVEDEETGFFTVKNEILVVKHDIVEDEEVKSFVLSHNGSIVGEIPQVGMYQIRFPDKTLAQTKTLLKEFRDSGLFESSILKSAATEESSAAIWYGSDLEVAETLSALSYWHIFHTNLPNAWALSKGSRNSLVAVADAGFFIVDNDEPVITEELEGRLVSLSTLYKGKPDLSSGCHGMHVSHTVASKPNNPGNSTDTRNNVAVAPYSRLMLYQFAPSSRKNESVVFWDSLAASIASAADEGATALNISLGLNWHKNGSHSGEYTPAAFEEKLQYFEMIAEEINGFFRPFVEYASQNGLILVKSAGNSSLGFRDVDSQKHFVLDPGRVQLLTPLKSEFPYTIVTVGSVNQMNERSLFSNVGNYVDVFAPGEDVYSVRIGSKLGSAYYFLGGLDGTSMAAPQVTGLIALMKARDPYLTSREIVAKLVEGAEAGEKSVSLNPEDASILPIISKDFYVMDAYETLKLVRGSLHAEIWVWNFDPSRDRLITFDGDASHLKTSDSTITLFEWSVNDTVVKTGSGWPGLFEYEFSDNGTYNVRLHIEDDLDNHAEDAVSVSLGDGSVRVIVQ